LRKPAARQRVRKTALRWHLLGGTWQVRRTLTATTRLETLQPKITFHTVTRGKFCNLDRGADLTEILGELNIILKVSNSNLGHFWLFSCLIGSALNIVIFHRNSNFCIPCSNFVARRWTILCPSLIWVPHCRDTVF